MKKLFTTLAMVTVFACSEQETETSTDPGVGAAGSSADEDSGLDQEPVAAKAEALTACYAARTKLKARYGCVSGWTDSGAGNEIKNVSGTCPNSKDFLAYSTSQTASAARFEVDYRNHQAGTGNWRFKEYLECPCDGGMTACKVVSAGLVAEPTPNSNSNSNTYSAAKAGCDPTYFCSELRRQIKQKLPGTWTTGSYCIDNPWLYRGPGGQTAAAYVTVANDFKQTRRVEASQRNPFNVTAECIEVLTAEQTE